MRMSHLLPVLALLPGIVAGCRSTPAEPPPPLGVTMRMEKGAAGPPAVVFLTFEDRKFNSATELLNSLRQRGVTAVTISSWAGAADYSPEDYAKLADAFREAGIGITGLYGYERDGDIQRRVDFAARPVLNCRIALIENSPEEIKLKSEPMSEVRYITIHNTAEPFSAQQERDRVYYRSGSTSFHFAVDETGAVQILPLDRHGWHAGDKRGEGNLNSIGIEICRSHCRGDRDELYRRSENNAVVLAALLLEKFKLDTDKLRMHQDWSGKFCPHRILEEKRWDDFKARVSRAREELKKHPVDFRPAETF